jgi:hypothetical protein
LAIYTDLPPGKKHGVKSNSYVFGVVESKAPGRGTLFQIECRISPPGCVICAYLSTRVVSIRQHWQREHGHLGQIHQSLLAWRLMKPGGDAVQTLTALVGSLSFLFPQMTVLTSSSFGECQGVVCAYFFIAPVRHNCLFRFSSSASLAGVTLTDVTLCSASRKNSKNVLPPKTMSKSRWVLTLTSSLPCGTRP